MTWLTWRDAMEHSLYGADGFFVRQSPAAHFRTSVALAGFADAVRRLADRVDAALGFPDPFDVVDVGAADGALLRGLGEVPTRWRLTGVERNGLFTAEIPCVTGLLVANEWLDNVPLDVLVDGRLVEVNTSGHERPGPKAHARDVAWAARWWPGDGRVEVGRSRDEAWSAAVARVDRGLAVAIDYGHLVAERRMTLTGYRDGRQVPPLPDGSCDLTAHVALDSCAAATGARLLTQRAALRSLELSAPRPARELADDPVAYLAALRDAGQAGALLDPDGLGGFTWLVQPVGIPDPLANGWVLGSGRG